MKKICALIFSFVIAFCGAMFLRNSNDASAETKQSLNYVSLGDSIAAGVGASGYTADGTFPEGSYAKNIKDYLEEKVGSGNLNAVNHAQSGDRSEDLLDKLKDATIEEDVTNADIITVCIGANDILGPAIANIEDYIYGTISQAEMEDILDKGIAAFDTNFSTLLDKLTELNSKANIIFTTIYNPYKVFVLPGELASIAQYIGISVDNINAMGSITEVYLAGGTNTQGEEVKGVNQRLKIKIESKNNEKLHLVDSKTVFDEYDGTYSDLVHVDASKITFSNFTNFSAYADPHPTDAGHELIYNQFKARIDTIYATQEKTTYTVTFDTKDGSAVASQTIEEGGFVQVPADPTKDGHMFLGWYSDEGCETEWDFNTAITSNVTIYCCC